MFNKHKSTDGYGLHTLYPPPGTSSSASTLDIVFIHGLGGTSHTTWTHGTTLWPRDLLAQDSPTARIMTWGYDARVLKFFGPVGTGSIQAHANELNNDLARERSSPEQMLRPLIFFAHSLGGLVVKAALFLSYREGVRSTPTPDITALLKPSTKGLIFASTPHRGSDKASWAKTATALASLLQKDHSSVHITALQRGSSVIETLQHTFTDIQDDFHIYTLLENVGFPTIGKVVEADSAVIGCTHEKQRLLDADHRGMVRYSSKEDNNYKKVAGIIKDISEARSRWSLWQEAAGNNLNVGWNNRNNFMAAVLEGNARPRSTGSPRGLLLGFDQHQQENQEFPFGRIDTLHANEPVNIGVHSPRRSSERLSTRTVPPPPPTPHRSRERLQAQPSTTTLGTIGSHSSTGSGGSGSSSRRSSAHENNTAADFQHLITQGRSFARTRGKNQAQNFNIARQYFTKAHNMLINNGGTSSSAADAASFTLVLYALMDIEFQLSFGTFLTPSAKLSHLQKAEQHGWDARAYASRQLPTLASDLAKTRLYIAIISGRKAEIHARLGVSASETRKQKSDAVAEIAAAKEEIVRLSSSYPHESVEFADVWTERLKETAAQLPDNRALPAELPTP